MCLKFEYKTSRIARIAVTTEHIRSGSIFKVGSEEHTHSGGKRLLLNLKLTNKMCEYNILSICTQHWKTFDDKQFAESDFWYRSHLCADAICTLSTGLSAYLTSIYHSSSRFSRDCCWQQSYLTVSMRILHAFKLCTNRKLWEGASSLDILSLFFRLQNRNLQLEHPMNIQWALNTAVSCNSPLNSCTNTYTHHIPAHRASLTHSTWKACSVWFPIWWNNNIQKLIIALKTQSSLSLELPEWRLGMDG